MVDITLPEEGGSRDVWGGLINADLVNLQAAINGLIASGGNGKSAYQTWLDNGHSGTESQFLDSLKGADGAPGTALNIKGTVADSSLLPGSGNTLGDCYLITGHLWVWTGSWTDTGSIQGPTGSTGPTGATGPAGANGFGNAIIIDDPAALRENPMSPGSGIPTGARVIWTTPTRPTNIGATDLWLAVSS